MEEKHYILIGGTRGIGKAFVQELDARKQRASIIGRHELDFGDRKRMASFPVDVADTDKLTATLQEIIGRQGKVSHLVFFQRFRGDSDDWQGEFDVSLSATKCTIDFLANHFDESIERSIVITSSRVSDFVTAEQPLSYHVAKAGLNQLVRYYAVQLGKKGIRANAVTPGTVLKEESRDFYLNNKELSDFYKSIIPLGRMGTSEDIVSVVDFLCSKAALFVTGQNIIVDGGLSLQLQESVGRQVANLPHPKATKG